MNHNFVSSRLLLVMMLMPLTRIAMASTTWYVDGVNGGDNNDCKAPQTACKTVGHGISLAASDDSIRVAAATYTENLTISITLKILGSGAKTTILDGGGVGRVISISSATAHVTLSGVTITNGNLGLGAGAGIGNGGVLTLLRSAVSGNRVSISGCDVNCHVFGGGIFNGGTLTIGNSIVSNNYVSLSGCERSCSAQGGGIYNVGTLLLYNSTMGYNKASPYGQGSGSGIYTASPGTAIIQSSTLSGSGSSGASTIWGTAAFQNSILANAGSAANCAGGVTSNGYNLSSDGTCNFNSTGDLSNTDPKLGVLGDYGGPTQTFPLLSGSPAIDAGNPSGCSDGQGRLLKTDQRGTPRPDKEDSGGCDMGAFERQRQ